MWRFATRALVLLAANEGATTVIWGATLPPGTPSFPGTRRSRRPGWKRWGAVPRRRGNPRSWREQRPRRRTGSGLQRPWRWRWRKTADIGPGKRCNPWLKKKESSRLCLCWEQIIHSFGRLSAWHVENVKEPNKLRGSASPLFGAACESEERLMRWKSLSAQVTFLLVSTSLSFFFFFSLTTLAR